MTIDVVTSCSKEGFEAYGARFLDTFHQFWPADVGLYVVSEDPLPMPTMEGRNVTYLLLAESAPQDVTDFYVRHAGNVRAHGLNAPRYARHGHYQFRFDAWKFSKKVFAINLAAARTNARRLIWLDADVNTYAEVTKEFLYTLPPRGTAIACLDRGPKYHSECGFVAYDLEHEATHSFIAEFQRLYTSDQVFGLKEWHDSFVFDWLRKHTRIPSYRIPHTNPAHPFVNSVLGRYMDHLKGNRKKDGLSRDHPRYGKPARPRPTLHKGKRIVT